MTHYYLGHPFFVSFNYIKLSQSINNDVYLFLSENATILSKII